MSELDRRELLKGLATLLPGASLLPGCAGAPPAQSATAQAPAPDTRQPSWAPALFDAEQALAVEDVAEQLLPETDTPGAKAAGVPAYIESLVQAVFSAEERADFLAGVDALNQQARTAHGASFAACTPEQQTLLLALLASRVVQAQKAAQQAGAGQGGQAKLDPVAHFWLSMRELTISGYSGSKLGATRLLGYDPIPGEYRGCVSLESVGKTWAL
jgi:glucoside 3-dehydrogenase (cytochrome c) hitch-hiker subunit